MVTVGGTVGLAGMIILIVGHQGTPHTEVVGTHLCDIHPMVEGLGGTDQGRSLILLMAAQTGGMLEGLGDAGKSLLTILWCCNLF